MTYDNIPKKTMDAMTRWSEHGVRPGSFLRAVLENDLFTAVGRADHENLPALPAIVSYVYQELPGDCHGSPIACDIWEIKKRTERAKEEVK
jgi:hypothetical protein